MPPMIDPGESSALRFTAANSMFGLEERIYSGAISAVLLGEGPFGRTPRRSMKKARESVRTCSRKVHAHRVCLIFVPMLRERQPRGLMAGGEPGRPEVLNHWNVIVQTCAAIPCRIQWRFGVRFPTKFGHWKRCPNATRNCRVRPKAGARISPFSPAVTSTCRRTVGSGLWLLTPSTT